MRETFASMPSLLGAAFGAAGSAAATRCSVCAGTKRAATASEKSSPADRETGFLRRTGATFAPRGAERGSGTLTETAAVVEFGFRLYGGAAVSDDRAWIVLSSTTSLRLPLTSTISMWLQLGNEGRMHAAVAAGADRGGRHAARASSAICISSLRCFSSTADAISAALDKPGIGHAG